MFWKKSWLTVLVITTMVKFCSRNVSFLGKCYFIKKTSPTQLFDYTPHYRTCLTSRGLFFGSVVLSGIFTLWSVIFHVICLFVGRLQLRSVHFYPIRQFSLYFIFLLLTPVCALSELKWSLKSICIENRLFIFNTNKFLDIIYNCINTNS